MFSTNVIFFQIFSTLGFLSWTQNLKLRKANCTQGGTAKVGCQRGQEGGWAWVHRQSHQGSGQWEGLTGWEPGILCDFNLNPLAVWGTCGLLRPSPISVL